MGMSSGGGVSTAPQMSLSQPMPQWASKGNGQGSLMAGQGYPMPQQRAPFNGQGYPMPGQSPMSQQPGFGGLGGVAGLLGMSNQPNVAGAMQPTQIANNLQQMQQMQQMPQPMQQAPQGYPQPSQGYPQPMQQAQAFSQPRQFNDGMVSRGPVNRENMPLMSRPMPNRQYF